MIETSETSIFYPLEQNFKNTTAAQILAGLGQHVNITEDNILRLRGEESAEWKRWQNDSTAESINLKNGDIVYLA